MVLLSLFHIYIILYLESPAKMNLLFASCSENAVNVPGPCDIPEQQML